MISVVIYGRNDNYGYNLHKRAAISFNCIAEVLTDPTDEILFVDYNTPDDFPTFPEAIQDTLTERARNLLRIFRVRPVIHERFKAKTHLVTLEPVARNVAVRRSHPSNRWILSTNTDMIFVPQRGRSLTEASRELPDGFYHAPRIEIPETLWESFDRKASRNIIDTVREWGSTLHLNEIVLGSKFIRYDGPGDFQLLLRDDLFKNHGFDEEMLLGWHVDSNIAKRMYLKYGEVGDFGTEIYGYHCDHTRQVTPAHSHTRLQNDWRRFVDNMDRSDVPEQADTWGCANDSIEELHLVANPAAFYVRALQEAIRTSQATPKICEYTTNTYNKGDYDPPHLLPFLADLFVSMPRSSNVAWHGERLETLYLFANVWDGLNFTGKILLDETAAAPPHPTSAIRGLPRSTVLAEADVFIFDFGGLPRASKEADDEDGAEPNLQRTFYQTFLEERRRSAAGLPPRRLIALNAINNSYEAFVCSFIAAAAAPYATHMRHGFVLLPAAGKQDWLPLVGIGEAGTRVGHEIKNDRNKSGWIIYGPNRYLDAGTYRLSLKIQPSPDNPDQPANAPCVIIEIFSGLECLDSFCIAYSDLRTDHHTFVFWFSLTEHSRLGGVEVRVRVVLPVEIVILALTLEPVPALLPWKGEKGEKAGKAEKGGKQDWLALVGIGEAGVRVGHQIKTDRNKLGWITYGPHKRLHEGTYLLSLQTEPLPEDLSRPTNATCMVIEIFSGEERLDAFNIACGDLGTDNLTFHFWVSRTAQNRPDGVEVRTRLVLPVQITILALTVERTSSLANAQDESELAVHPLLRHPDWLPFLHIGPSGQIHQSGGVEAKKGTAGFVVFGPYWTVPAGHYELIVRLVPDQLSHRTGLIAVDVATEAGERVIAKRVLPLWPFQLLLGCFLRELRLPFELPADLPEKSRRIETRLWTRGATSFLIQSVAVRPAAQARVPASLSHLEKISGALAQTLSRLRANVRRRLKAS